MRNLYDEVDLMIRKVNLNDIWPGFSLYKFALYDSENVYFKNEVIPYNQRFLGNTAVEYDGEFIAIWNVPDPQEEDVQLLAAGLVHEMFHAYQRSKGESRFPNDLVMLNYPDDLENYQIKHAEHLSLVKAYSSNDLVEKKRLFNQFLSARKYRQEWIGDIINQEYYTETIEGMAEYAGCMALKQLSIEKYDNRLKEYLENLSTLNGLFFDIRRMLYFSGAVFCLVMKDLDIDFYHEIGKEKASLFEIISKDAQAVKPWIDRNALRLLTEENARTKKEKFDKFLHTHPTIVKTDFVICGYDPMNMIKMDDMILCNHFIMLKSAGEAAPLFIQGPVLLKLKSGSVNQVHSYMK